MPLVLDIQGFKVENNKFIVKEMAAFNGHKISHYVFKSPFPKRHLPPDLEKQATWLTNNYHCIDWNEGYTPFHNFSNIVRSLTAREEIIYVKGKEKADYISEYSLNSVYELGEYPPIPFEEPRCFYHIKPKCICSLTNVYYLYENFIMS